jgi:mannose-6-phosphate isomerase-like protein (cupin superfamily)
MAHSLKIDFEPMLWQPHPTLEAIMTRFTGIDVPEHPAFDTLIARVDVGGAIPTHNHETTCEIAYVIAGTGLFYEGESEAAQAHPVQKGCALFIAPATWHAIENTGSEPMLIFAVHTTSSIQAGSKG